jgi:hypothetical protein
MELLGVVEKDALARRDEQPLLVAVVERGGAERALLLGVDDVGVGVGRRARQRVRKIVNME